MEEIGFLQRVSQTSLRASRITVFHSAALGIRFRARLETSRNTRRFKLGGRRQLQAQGRADVALAAHRHAAHWGERTEHMFDAARGVALRQLRCFCVCEIGCCAVPLRWICTLQPGSARLFSRSALGQPRPAYTSALVLLESSSHSNTAVSVTASLRISLQRLSTRACSL